MGVLDEPCLVLNRNWEPVTFQPVKVSIVTAMRDMANVLDTKNYLLLPFDEWCQHTPENAVWIKTASQPIAAPEIIVLKEYGERPPRKVNFNRLNLIKRDQHECQYCGEAVTPSKFQVEHIVPRSRDGETSWLNCVASCRNCNQQKRDQTPEEAGMKLRKKPAKPKWKPEMMLPKGPIKPSWELFLKKAAS